MQFPNRNKRIDPSQELWGSPLKLDDGTNSIKIKKLRDAEREYNSRPKITPDIAPTKNMELNDDMFWEIGKYIGKNCGLLNTEVRSRWMRSGITINYDHVVRNAFPKYLSEYVTKIVIDRYNPKEEVFSRFPNIREVVIKQLSVSIFGEDIPNIPELFSNIERLHIDHQLRCDHVWKVLVEKINKDNLYIDFNSTLIKYQDYKEMREKTPDTDLIERLKNRDSIDLETKNKYSIMFSDLALAYLYFNERVRSIPRKIPKITLSVIIVNDPSYIDYCLHVFVNLYKDLGIKIELDLYGRSSQNKNLDKKICLFDALFIYETDILQNMLELSIDNYLINEMHRNINI